MSASPELRQGLLNIYPNNPLGVLDEITPRTVLQEGSQIPTQYGIALDKALNLQRIVQDETITPTMKVFYFQELVKVSLQVGIPPEKEDLWSQAEQRLRDLRKERWTTIGLQTSVPLPQAPKVEHPLSRKWSGSYNLPLPLRRANLVDKSA